MLYPLWMLLTSKKEEVYIRRGFLPTSVCSGGWLAHCHFLAKGVINTPSPHTHTLYRPHIRMEGFKRQMVALAETEMKSAGASLLQAGP